MSRLKRLLAQHIPAELLQSNLDEWGVEGAEITPSKLAYATTITPAVIEEAYRNGVDLIVSHHQCWPFMQGEREAVEALLDQYQICNLWCHVPLDMADFGTAVSLLKLIGGQPFQTIGEGHGRVARFEVARPLGAIEAELDQKLGERSARRYDNGRLVKTVATVTGAGCSLAYVNDALQAGADLYITGETNLYQLEYAKFKGLSMLVYSHNYTEVFGIQALCERLGVDLCLPVYGHLDEPHF